MIRLLFLTVLFLSYNLVSGQLPTKLEKISDTKVSPYNNICFLQIYRDRFPKSDGWNASTGFFIAPNIILTAAHNIYSVKGSRVTAIKVIPGKYYDHSPYGIFEVNGQKESESIIRTNPKYVFMQGSGKRIKNDFGIIILPKDSFKELSKDAFTLKDAYNLKKGDTLNVAGYPANKRFGYNGDYITSQMDVCRLVGDKVFNHRLETFGGNSGSPIWVNIGNSRVLVGVHTFGNAGTLIDPENMKIIREWLDKYAEKSE